MEFEYAVQFERSARRLRSVPDFMNELEHHKAVLSTVPLAECIQLYDLTPLQGMPESKTYKGYKLRKFKTKSGRRGIRLLLCLEFNEQACSKIHFIDVRDDPDHEDKRLKKIIHATVHQFIMQKIADQSGRTDVSGDR